MCQALGQAYGIRNTGVGPHPFVFSKVLQVILTLPYIIPAESYHYILPSRKFEPKCTPMFCNSLVNFNVLCAVLSA